MKVNDLVLGILLLLFCVAGLLYTNLTFPVQPDGTPGPSFFPNVLFSLLVICSLSLIIKYIIRKVKVPFFALTSLDIKGIVSIVVLLAFVLLYIYYSDAIGFIPLSFVTILCLSLWLRVDWKVSLISAAVTTAVIYIVFVKILLVPLPQGLISI